LALVTLFLLTAIRLPLRAEETNSNAKTSPPRLNFDSFRIISERNIFDPNRSARSDNRPSRREPERRVRTESFALLGTMGYEKGWFAFFDGTSSDYRKALQPGDTMAGYRVEAIGPSHVTLESNGKQIELRVGSEMRRQDEGEWSVSARSEASGSAGPSESSGSAGTSAAKAEAGPSGEQSDVLKRLLQKREQELQNEKK
jgi:hypothetical protein